MTKPGSAQSPAGAPWGCGAALCACSSTHRPVVVHVAQLVGEALHVVGFQLAGVVHHVVVGGRHAAVLHRLAHDEEIVPAGGQTPLLHRGSALERSNCPGTWLVVFQPLYDY